MIRNFNELNNPILYVNLKWKHYSDVSTTCVDLALYMNYMNLSLKQTLILINGLEKISFHENHDLTIYSRGNSVIPIQAIHKPPTIGQPFIKNDGLIIGEKIGY